MPKEAQIMSRDMSFSKASIWGVSNTNDVLFLVKSDNGFDILAKTE
jgi:hypothetical protein